MTSSSEEEAEWAAVYGAYVALQVRDYVRTGQGLPGYPLMQSFVEEAEEIANRAKTAYYELRNDRTVV